LLHFQACCAEPPRVGSYFIELVPKLEHEDEVGANPSRIRLYRSHDYEEPLCFAYTLCIATEQPAHTCADVCVCVRVQMSVSF